MDDLTAFLNARLDEDEAAAKAWRSPDWYQASRAVYMDLGGGGRLVAECPLPFGSETAPAAHIARHDPARVLREAEAKRAILARYGSLPSVTNLGEHLQRSQEQVGLDYAIRLLAAIYSDHPDYRPEWKP